DVRAGIPAAGEREATPDEPHSSAARLPRDRLRTDRVSLSLTPLRLVVTKPPTKLRHLRSLLHAVVCLPAARGLELLLGQNLPHVDIVGDRRRTQAWAKEDLNLHPVARTGT